jgi:hypothetical protein
MEKKPNLAIAFRFISGVVFGFEIMPFEGVHFQLQLGIIEIVVYNPEIIEDL